MNRETVVVILAPPQGQSRLVDKAKSNAMAIGLVVL